MRTTAHPGCRPADDRTARNYVLQRSVGQLHQRSRPACTWSPRRSAICATSRCGRWKRWPRADLIACEDTRVTRKLLDHYGIATPLTPYHEHNAAAARPKILARLAEGAAVALVSDAGTPLVSDPGYKLVRAAREAGHAVTRVAGRLRRAGGARRSPALPTDRFFFEGFLPSKDGPAAQPHRRARAHSGDAGPVRDRPAARRARSPTSPPGLGRARRRSAASSPSCTRRCGAATSRRSRATMPTAPEPRGEIVIVIAPPDRRTRRTPTRSTRCCAARWRALSVKDAVAEVAAATGQPRREVYQRALALAKEEPSDGARVTSGPARPSAARAAGRSGRSRSGTGLSAESRAAVLLIAKGYPHRRAALAQPGRRDRHRGAPPQRCWCSSR